MVPDGTNTVHLKVLHLGEYLLWPRSFVALRWANAWASRPDALTIMAAFLKYRFILVSQRSPNLFVRG